MSTPYRSSGCARCGAALPSETQAETEGSRAPDSPLCERCVLEAIADARRLLERLEARPTRAPTSRFERYVTFLGLLALGGVAVQVVIGTASTFMAHRQLRLSRAAVAQTQAASLGDTSAAPRVTSQVAPPRDPMAGSLTAWAGAAGRAPDPPQPFAQATGSLPWPPAILATTGKSVTHDPQELFARAERLAESGLDITLHETRLSSASLPLGSSTGLGPVFRDGQPIGVKVSLPGPLLESVGLESGDLVTSVNGYGYPEDPKSWAEPFLKPSGNVVFEVLRGTRRVVLSVRWRRPVVD